MSSDSQNRPILVTGGAGFIGSHLVEALVRRGQRVTVIDNLSTGHLDNLTGVIDEIQFIEHDLRHDDLRPLLAEENFATIFHLAGNVNIPRSVETPRQDFEMNALATFNLIEALRETAPQTPLIYASTAAVYGNGAPVPYRESDPTTPVAPYGVSKLAAERYLAVYARLYGMPTASLRLFPVYGPRLRQQVVFDLIQKVCRNPTELFIYGDGSQVRDFNHVANVVQALLTVAERAPLEGEVYNAAGEEPLCIRDLAGMICEVMAVRPRLVYSGQTRPGDAQRWTADISRLKGLGYRPRLRLADGLADMVAWVHQLETNGS